MSDNHNTGIPKVDIVIGAISLAAYGYTQLVDVTIILDFVFKLFSAAGAIYIALNQGRMFHFGKKPKNDKKDISKD